jgi:hypothetical protein
VKEKILRRVRNKIHSRGKRRGTKGGEQSEEMIFGYRFRHAKARKKAP